MLDFNDLPAQDKLYYLDAESGIAIYCADNRDILPLLPDKSIDLVLTDPPYGINLNLAWLSELNVAHSKPANRIDVPIIGDTGLDTLFCFDYPKWAVWGFPYIFNGKAAGWLVWNKQPGLLDTDRTMTSPVEMLSTNLWKGFRIVRCIWAGYLRDGGEHRFEHPTQKPQKIFNYVINKVPSNSIILDPFLGSGTTAYCAKKPGRKCIGIEIEEKYCEIAKKRLAQSVMRLE